jgi:hypothetical protein
MSAACSLVFSPCKTAELASLFPPLDVDPSRQRTLKGALIAGWRLEVGHCP